MYDFPGTIDSPAESRRLDILSPSRSTGSLRALLDPAQRPVQKQAFPIVIEVSCAAVGSGSTRLISRTGSGPSCPDLRSGSSNAFADHDALLDGYGLDAANIQVPSRHVAEQIIAEYSGHPKAAADEVISPARELRSA